MTQTAPTTLFLAGADVISVENIKSPTPARSYPKKPAQRSQRQSRIVWRNVIGFIVLHSLAFYGLLMCISTAKRPTIIFTVICGYFGGVGITAGAHRLWAHKCYKAKWPLRLLLMFFQTMAFQNHIYEWVRDHRVHHKFTDTDADPHNSKRGFFFSHIGWLMVRKHRDVINKGKTVDMSDLEQDAIVMWQKKHYLKLMPICTFVIPTLIPHYLWGETLWVAFLVAVLRYVLSLNFTWLVNSAAHI